MDTSDSTASRQILKRAGNRTGWTQALVFGHGQT